MVKYLFASPALTFINSVCYSLNGSVTMKFPNDINRQFFKKQMEFVFLEVGPEFLKRYLDQFCP